MRYDDECQYRHCVDWQSVQVIVWALSAQLSLRRQAVALGQLLTDTGRRVVIICLSSVETELSNVLGQIVIAAAVIETDSASGRGPDQAGCCCCLRSGGLLRSAG